jgi:hypothetical protein
MKSAKAYWMSDSFQPVPRCSGLHEERPGVLQVRNHDHRDERRDELKPAIVNIQVSLLVRLKPTPRRSWRTRAHYTIGFLGGQTTQGHPNRDAAAPAREQISGEVRFDAVTRALYSTDASVYQIHPLGVVIAKSREDILRTVNLARTHGVPSPRGRRYVAGGQAIGSGLQIDTSKYYNRILELNVGERGRSSSRASSSTN